MSAEIKEHIYKPLIKIPDYCTTRKFLAMILEDAVSQTGSPWAPGTLFYYIFEPLVEILNDTDLKFRVERFEGLVESWRHNGASKLYTTYLGMREIGVTDHASLSALILHDLIFLLNVAHMRLPKGEPESLVADFWKNLHGDDVGNIRNVAQQLLNRYMKDKQFADVKVTKPIVTGGVVSLFYGIRETISLVDSVLARDSIEASCG